MVPDYFGCVDNCRAVATLISKMEQFEAAAFETTLNHFCSKINSKLLEDVKNLQSLKTTKQKHTDCVLVKEVDLFSSLAAVLSRSSWENLIILTDASVKQSLQEAVDGLRISGSRCV